jgi:hypothetical protein
LNRYDVLLEWASERGGGRISDLRRVAAGLVRENDLENLIDDLVALGHLDRHGASWRIAPPLLTRLADGGGNSLLVGARPAWLVDALAALDAHAEPSLVVLGEHVYENVLVPQHGPSSWYFSITSEGDPSALASLGVHAVDDASGAVLTGLLENGPPGTRRTVRPGELIGSLPADHARFVGYSTQHDSEPSAYVYLRNGQRIFAQRRADGTWFETSRAWARWLGCVHRKRLLWASPRDRCLFVAAEIRLPSEVERVVLLRSGRLPESVALPDGVEAGRRVVRYVNVTYSIAESIAGLLRKDLTQI